MPDEGFAGFLHRDTKRRQPGETFTPPITMTSVFSLPGGTEADHQYGRWSNPTWTALEEALGFLEQAPVLTFPSGMAATAAVLYGLLRSGDRVLLPSDGYYTTLSFAKRYLVPWGIGVDTCPTREFEKWDLGGFRLVWIETPSNPRLDLVDIAEVAVRADRAGAILVVDNTTMTPLGQRPLEFGADVIISSDTKATSGHSDVVFGHVASRNPDLIDFVRNWRNLGGAIPGPFEAWLVHRGLETLEVRFQRMSENALRVAERLQQHPAVAAISYPGLSSHPQHDLAKRQMTSFGSVVALTLADQPAAEQFIAACPHLRPTTSFGGIHTSAERRARWGEEVPDGFVRLSLGAEPTDDLVAAIEAALD
ncbi:MAG: cystathionine gamma-lyase [Acidimicrobiia bacterium]